MQGKGDVLISVEAPNLWVFAKTYGVPGDDYAYSITQTQDSGFAVAGYTQSYGAVGYDCPVLKMAANVQYTGCVADCTPTENAVSPSEDSPTLFASSVSGLADATPYPGTSGSMPKAIG